MERITEVGTRCSSCGEQSLILIRLNRSGPVCQPCLQRALDFAKLPVDARITVTTAGTGTLPEDIRNMIVDRTTPAFFEDQEDPDGLAMWADTQK